MRRRELLGAVALLALSGCRLTDALDLGRLEREYDAVLGLWAVHTGTGAEVTHRADERFAFCSTFKGLAAAAALASGASLGRTLRFTEADLMDSSFITRDHVGDGMTLRAVCDAAVRFSDGTAGNLLLREIGGPAGLTRYLRGLGDDVTRSDREEPFVARAEPGDPRDTTTPRAIGTDYREIVLGDALAPARRAFLTGLMKRNTTGDNRIRAGLPRGWTVADKTGTGAYGAANDVAIAWPPRSDPLVIAVMTRGETADAEPREALIAEAAGVAARALTR